MRLELKLTVDVEPISKFVTVPPEAGARIGEELQAQLRKIFVSRIGDPYSFADDGPQHTLRIEGAKVVVKTITYDVKGEG